jgi:hypothetical protein
VREVKEIGGKHAALREMKGVIDERLQMSAGSSP